MSRVGSSAINIPADVTVSHEGGLMVVKGKNGELSAPLHGDVELSLADNVATLKPVRDTRQAKALWGTMRASLNNMVLRRFGGFHPQAGDQRRWLPCRDAGQQAGSVAWLQSSG
jgi:large subunit ribosomal protein L6